MGRRSYNITEKKTRLCAAISYDYKQRLDVLCTKLDKSVSSIINDAVGEILRKYENQGIYNQPMVQDNNKKELYRMLETDGQKHKGTSIVIANHKGGVGKTTMTASLAVLMAKKGKRVLLIDLDAQMNLSNLFGYGAEDDKKNIAYYIGDCMSKISNDEDDYADISDFIHGTSYNSINIITASSRMRDDNFGSSIMRANGSLITQTVFDIVLDKIRALSIYDYVLIDSSPNMNETVLSAIRAADWVLSPTDIDIDGFKGTYKIDKFIKSVSKRGVKVAKLAGVVFNRANTSRGMTKAIPEFKGQFVNAGIHCFNTVIPEVAIVSNEKINNRIAVDVRPTSKISKKYEVLLEEVVKIIG